MLRQAERTSSRRDRRTRSHLACRSVGQHGTQQPTQKFCATEQERGNGPIPEGAAIDDGSASRIVGEIKHRHLLAASVVGGLAPMLFLNSTRALFSVRYRTMG